MAASPFISWMRAQSGAPVFVNSLGTGFRIWNGVVSRLGRQFRILRYDKRGHGLSDVARTPYGIDDHVSDLAALLDQRSVTQATVVGLSVGGQIALGLAARRPDSVGALVLLDTAHRIGTPESWTARISAVQAGGLESIADAVLERWLSPGYRRDHADMIPLWRNMLARTPTAGYIATCAALRDADLTEDPGANPLSLRSSRFANPARPGQHHGQAHSRRRFPLDPRRRASALY
jgi:3-oxoadipate enol-lactonase